MRVQQMDGEHASKQKKSHQINQLGIPTATGKRLVGFISCTLMFEQDTSLRREVC